MFVILLLMISEIFNNVFKKIDNLLNFVETICIKFVEHLNNNSSIFFFIFLPEQISENTFYVTKENGNKYVMNYTLYSKKIVVIVVIWEKT